MARRIEIGDDTAINMTPMIDICFQLIVFFMLTLRFKSIDRRFELQMPKDRGPSTQPARVDPLTRITVRLFRKNREGTGGEPFTRIRVGERSTFELPRGPWPVGAEAEAARLKAEDAVLAQVERAIEEAWSEQGRNPGVCGEIRTPAPDGASVPHGDVVRVLDAFLAAGLTTVVLEGAPAPQPARDGGGWTFD